MQIIQHLAITSHMAMFLHIVSTKEPIVHGLTQYYCRSYVVPKLDNISTIYYISNARLGGKNFLQGGLIARLKT